MKIALAQTNLLSRELVSLVCTQLLGYEIVGESDDGLSAISVVRKTRPDLVIMDYRLPKLSISEFVARVRRLAWQTKIIIITPRCDPQTIIQIQRANADGVVEESMCSFLTFSEALRKVEAGETSFPKCFGQTKGTDKSENLRYTRMLSRRQEEILDLIADYCTDRQIAQKMEVSQRTIQNHRLHIGNKFSVKSRIELIRHARHLGFGHLSQNF